MSKIQSGLLLALIIATVVVAIDLLFFKHHIAERLMVNIGIVLIIGAFFLRFFKR